MRAAYAKNGESRTVNLNTVTRNALRVLFERTESRHVFRNRKGKPLRSIRNTFNNARKKATRACHRATKQQPSSGSRERTLRQIPQRYSQHRQKEPRQPETRRGGSALKMLVEFGKRGGIEAR